MPKNGGHGQAAILSDVDFSKIKKNLVSSKHKLICDIAWWTGERLGAVVKLPVASVYNSQGKPLDYITFPARTRKACPNGKRKTRQVPVHANLKEILADYWKIYKPVESSFLFPGISGEKPLEFQSADDALRRAISKAGLESKGISTHSFRRTFITNLSKKGIAIATIQKITGHSDLKVLSRYVEVSEDQIKEAIATL